jgi:hypothetical protein
MVFNFDEQTLQTQYIHGLIENASVMWTCLMFFIIFCAVQHEEFCLISGMSEIKARFYILFCSCRLCSDSGCNVGYVLHGHLCIVLHFTFNNLVAKLLHYSKQNTAAVVYYFCWQWFQ